MTFPDLASLAKTMAAAKIVEFSAGGVSVRLHDSAFAPKVRPGKPQDPKVFGDMPSDEDLTFWSVEEKEAK